MIALLFVHLVVGVTIVAAGKQLSRRALLVAVVPPLAALAWLSTQLRSVLDGSVVTQSWEWVPALGLSIDLRLDAFSALMVLVVSGIGLAVLAYGASYFRTGWDGLGRLVGLLTLFAGAMLGLVLADNLLFLYVCWELTSITSYLLIGNEWRQPRARAAALQALLVTAAGGLVMLGGFVVLGEAADTYRLSAILADPPSGLAVGMALGLVLVGAFSKSAQYPFHFWLPGAMVAPTPVSAYLHSATMVKAGVYLVARLAPAFALVWGWRPALVVVGLVSMVLGGVRALRQHDLKLLLAYGTVAQLGFMMVLFGVGTEAATMAGCVLLAAHALFKATLFFVVGVIDHSTGTRDIRLLGGLGEGWGLLKVVAVVAAASMAGVPLTMGFIAKEGAYQAFVDGDISLSVLVLAGIVVGSVLTCAYSARFVWGAFSSAYTGGPAAAPEPVADPGSGASHEPRIAPAPRQPVRSHDRPHHAPSWVFVAPGAVLVALTAIWGVAPQLISPLLGGSVEALGRSWSPVELSLWHGWTLVLALSLLTLAAGAGVFAGQRAAGRRHAEAMSSDVGAAPHRPRPLVPSGSVVYLWALRGLNVVADRVTGVLQSGSLPVYAGVILATAAILPGAALVLGWDWPGWPDLIGSGAQVPIVAVMIGGAVAAATVGRRFAAALLLGTTGYAMAALFVVQGAPDLALTQVVVETLSVVAFVLVLRRLPDRFEHQAPRIGHVIRLGVAGLVAAMVFSLALVAGGQRGHDSIETGSVSENIVDDALPEGDGKNVVNVILVDFRGFDTLGEISVLAVAAIGAVALARARREAPR